MTYKELKEFLIKCSDLYYKDSISIISDKEFDEKIKLLEKMEEEQGFADEDSPTRTPGSDQTSAPNLENAHKRPMLSLDNTYNKEDVDKWFTDMQMYLGKRHPKIIVSPKWDGMSGAIRIKDGKFYKALTRGDGHIGEDITQNVGHLYNNIWKIKNNFSGEVRGEIIMTKEFFKEINSDGRYQNPRNLVSGSMKLLDLEEFKERAPGIIFTAYWLEDSKNDYYEDDLKELESLGFYVGPYFVCDSEIEILEALDKIKDLDLPVEIDGAVLKLNHKYRWEDIGSTAHAPRWAKAYKYNQEIKETTIEKIEFWVGRTGKITPLAYFTPILIDGSTVQKATLNNAVFYNNIDVAVGDKVEVQKAAAIIPQIVSVVERPKNRVKVKFPTKCPNCGTILKKHNEDQNDYFCDNSMCSARIVDQIVNYTHSIECDGFAEIVVERLYENNLLHSISDLYELKNHKDEIAKLDRMSINMADKLCDNIEKSKTADFWKVLAGLGIPNVGPKTAKILAKRFKSVNNLMEATATELTNVEDIGSITAEGISIYFSENKELIKKLIDYGVKMEEESKNSTTSLAGKVFCITGELSKPRNEYITIIENNGGKVTGSVSKNTNYLITNTPDSNTKKNVTARSLGIPVIDEEEFLRLI